MSEVVDGETMAGAIDGIMYEETRSTWLNRRRYHLRILLI